LVEFYIQMTDPDGLPQLHLNSINIKLVKEVGDICNHLAN